MPTIANKKPSSLSKSPPWPGMSLETSFLLFFLFNQLSKRSPTEVKKLERKSLVSYIYIGSPRGLNRKKQFGTKAKIQLNDSYANVGDIQAFIAAERESRAEEEKPLLTTSIKADVDVKMGIVSDVKEELRKAQAYKINYSTRKEIK